MAATRSLHKASNTSTEANGKKRKCEEEEINKWKEKKCHAEEDRYKKIMTSLENVAVAIKETHTIFKESNMMLFILRKKSIKGWKLLVLMKIKVVKFIFFLWTSRKCKGIVWMSGSDAKENPRGNDE